MQMTLELPLWSSLLAAVFGIRSEGVARTSVLRVSCPGSVNAMGMRMEL